MAAIFKLPFKWPFMGILAMAPYSIFLSTFSVLPKYYLSMWGTIPDRYF